MFKHAFKKLELEEIALLLEDINPALEAIDFDPVHTDILSINVPFYAGYSFLDITDHLVPANRRFVLFKPATTGIEADVVVLDWTNEPIYLLNARAPIQLDENNVADYVRFFFAYVRGKFGRFIISENVDDILWKEEPPPQARKAISKMLLKIEPLKEENGVFFLKATMMFKDSLFQSDIEVKSSGFVTLSNEELLVEDMPIRDDIFGQ